MGTRGMQRRPAWLLRGREAKIVSEVMGEDVLSLAGCEEDSDF